MQTQFEIPFTVIRVPSMGQWVVRFRVELVVWVQGNQFEIPFLIDWGTDVSHLPAKRHPELISVIPAAAKRRRFRTAAGDGEGRECQFVFSFQLLRDWKFPSYGKGTRALVAGLGQQDQPG